MGRYNQIEYILSHERPKSILEIGAWKGKRAISMCRAAGCTRYIGFDLFEEASPDTDKLEMNIKPHYTVADVQKKLEAAGINATLIKGNTRKTLAEFLETGEKVDFAFIDGGHSVETIQSDWDHVKKIVKPGKMVIFDDYYTNIPPGLDLNLYGANRVVEKIKGAAVMPSTDPVHGGGIVHIVLVKTSP